MRWDCRWDPAQGCTTRPEAGGGIALTRCAAWLVQIAMAEWLAQFEASAQALLDDIARFED